ncbi:MAG: tetratricopeptide repeat protein [Flavobacterium sp.]|nr:tetratricopeptide repeat protein [Pedobacter sp.]
MLKKQQFLVISIVAILMAILLSLNIKGLVKPSEEKGAINEQPDVAKTATYSIEQASVDGKIDLNANLTQQIKDLEISLQQASGTEKLAVQKQLAQSWDDVNKPAPASFYYEIIAQKENNFNNWLKTADRFSEAYHNTQDSVVKPFLVQKAGAAYQKAIEFNKNSLDARTGLGVAYVNGSGSPMQGIQLLLGVVKEDPENINANLNLGLFSMKSGQYDKAIARFRTVVAQNNDPEAWFYLASSYENLGKIDDAIASYIKTKELAADPSLGQFVDRKIKELKK